MLIDNCLLNFPADKVMLDNYWIRQDQIHVLYFVVLSHPSVLLGSVCRCDKMSLWEFFMLGRNAPDVPYFYISFFVQVQTLHFHESLGCQERTRWWNEYQLILFPVKVVFWVRFFPMCCLWKLWEGLSKATSLHCIGRANGTFYPPLMKASKI